MRRTMICRSSAILAGIMASAAALAAQNPPAIQRPISQAQGTQQAVQRSTQAQTGQAPDQGRVQITSGEQGDQQQAIPATHTVQQGESLWQLAQQYLGDPLLWPEIYRLNTDVVEDPHWIYPGEELRLQPGEEEPLALAPAPADTGTVNVTVTPTSDSAAAPVAVQPRVISTGPTIFATVNQPRISTTAIDARSASAYRAVREGEYYASGFLTEGLPLPSGRVLANAQTSVRGAIRTTTTARVFERVVISTPPDTPLDSGALLLVFRRGDEVPGYGEVIIPTGLLRVYDPTGDRPLAEVVRQFDRVSEGQEVIPVAPFRFESNAHPQPVENGVTGRVIRLRDRREVPTLQVVLFLDKGANDGVRLGDIFALTLEQPDGQGGTLVQDQARALVVSTRERTSTAVIIELYRGDVSSRSGARQVRRLP